MSKESIEFFIGKTALDAEFRNWLFANPDEALSARLE
jgi:hypothetical protein